MTDRVGAPEADEVAGVDQPQAEIGLLRLLEQLAPIAAEREEHVTPDRMGRPAKAVGRGTSRRRSGARWSTLLALREVDVRHRHRADRADRRTPPRSRRPRRSVVKTASSSIETMIGAGRKLRAPRCAAR